MDDRRPDRAELERRATSLPDVEKLNDMQRMTLDSDARQIVLIAPTGSGKTLAFGICVLKHLHSSGGPLQALVIAPSRELVLQIASVMRQLAKGYKTVALYGGHNMADEVASLTPVPQIIVATPGRFLDHLQRGTLSIEHRLDIIVLDEYDKALQLGFEADMKRIMKRVGAPRNFVLTSATPMAELPAYLNLRSPELIEAVATPEGKREVVTVESFSRDKLDTLIALLKRSTVGDRALVFVNHRESAERVYRSLCKHGVAAGLYHGALDQQQRMVAVDLFANGTTPVLVATDLAARGLDIKDVDSVIHYHLPVDEAAWVHRNGRTARQSARGTVYVIHSEADDLPDYVKADRPYSPDPSEGPDMTGDTATLYFQAGKKEKISKGDILGFILANSQLTAAEIGRIDVHDHFALAAVPRQSMSHLIANLNSAKLKGRKVRVSEIG